MACAGCFVGEENDVQFAVGCAAVCCVGVFLLIRTKHLEKRLSEQETKKKVTEAAEQKRKNTIICKCPACGAPVKGIRGEQVSCEYCGTYVTVENGSGQD